MGESYKKSLTKKIKSVKAYHHGKRLKDRARLGEELVKLNQKINEELPKSTLKIGFQDGKFFEMLVIKSIKIDPETKQETTIIQGMLVQEPNRSTKERQLKPSGILILPWTVDRHTTPDGKIFVNIALRNEPGADNLVTLTTGEQTSASKLMGIDPRKEPGRAHLAVCVQETLAVKCENVPELRDIIPDKFIATRGIRDGNRMSGGHNGYGIIEIDHGSPLLPLYEANNWIELDTLQEMILESAKGEALVSEYLLANLSLLYAHLRTEDKVRINNLETMLGDISTNPFTLKNLGWMIGVMHNYLEKLTKTK